MRWEEAQAALLETEPRQPCRASPLVPRKPGVYGLFLASDRIGAWKDLGPREKLFANGKPAEPTLLYVGVATDALHKRYHPTERSCRNSSPRFSFGALLRCALALRLERRDGAKAHFRFTKCSEARLTRWLVENLCYSSVVLSGERSELESLEARLIRSLKPPLNIKLLPAENRDYLKARREACKRLVRGEAMEGCGG